MQYSTSLRLWCIKNVYLSHMDPQCSNPGVSKDTPERDNLMIHLIVASTNINNVRFIPAINDEKLSVCC